MNIIFLDFDGPMIPLRAYYMEGQTSPWVTKFDPIAVGLLNRLAEKAQAKIVVHSSWRKTAINEVTDIKAHLLQEGVKEEYLHEELLCPMKLSSSRWTDIHLWLEDNHATKYVILEDEDLPYGREDLKPNFVKVSFEEGFTYAPYLKALDIFDLAEGDILV